MATLVANEFIYVHRVFTLNQVLDSLAGNENVCSVFIKPTEVTKPNNEDTDNEGDRNRQVPNNFTGNQLRAVAGVRQLRNNLTS